MTEGRQQEAVPVSRASDSEGDLIALQKRFAANIRNPETAQPLRGVDQARMAVYQELFLSNIQGALESAFPVACESLGAELWLSLVGRFWREHRSQTPEYPRLAGEFLTWFQTAPELGTPPWLGDLLIWEHAELDALLAPDTCPELLPDATPVPARCYTPAASLRVFGFDWPVHRITADWQPDESAPVFLACFRNPAFDVEFLELMPASALLLEKVQDRPHQPIDRYLEELVRELGMPLPAIQGFVTEFLSELVNRGALHVSTNYDRGK